MFEQIGPRGLTKAWRGNKGGYRVTFREGGVGPLTFTLFLSRRLRPEFFYIALRLGDRWFRWHRGGIR